MRNDSNRTASYTQSDAAIDMPTPRLHILREGSRPTVARPIVMIPDGSELAIGRAVEHPDVRLDDHRVSRHHASLHTHMCRMSISDNSRNGTFVNGAPITRKDLVEGDVIRIGDSLLLARYSSHHTEDVEVEGLLGDSSAMRGLRAMIARMAPTDARVVILGETGTGKELIARALHTLSGRTGPFVAVNCSTITESLAESELFGHVGGAFTGAIADRSGYFRAAHRGTLFLDELGDLPDRVQPKLLRALEERVVMPVGTTHTDAVDTRIVAATNADISELVDRGEFRSDVYARLAEVILHSAPLRERREDVLPLMRVYLGSDAPPLSGHLAEALVLHPWPYNVRELRSVAKHLLVNSDVDDRLMLAMAPDSIASPRADRPTDTVESGQLDPEPASPNGVSPTYDVVLALVQEHKGNVARMSRALRRSRQQVYRYLEKYNIDIAAYR